MFFYSLPGWLVRMEGTLRKTLEATQLGLPSPHLPESLKVYMEQGADTNLFMCPVLLSK